VYLYGTRTYYQKSSTGPGLNATISSKKYRCNPANHNQRLCYAIGYGPATYTYFHVKTYNIIAIDIDMTPEYLKKANNNKKMRKFIT